MKLYNRTVVLLDQHRLTSMHQLQCFTSVIERFFYGNLGGGGVLTTYYLLQLVLMLYYVCVLPYTSPLWLPCSIYRLHGGSCRSPCLHFHEM